MFAAVRLFSRSILAKLLLALVVPLLAVGLFNSVYYPARQRSLVLEKSEENVASLREMLAFAVGAGLGEGNFGLVQATFDWVRENPSIIYVGVLDEQDEPLVVYDTMKVDLRGRLASRDTMATLDGRILASASPILYNGTRYGTVLLGYSLVDASADIAASRRSSWLINLSAFVLSVATVALFARLLVRQIVSLRDAAREVGRGRHDVEINVRAKDELGELGRAFQEMTANLRTSFSTVQQKTEDAEAAAREARLAHDAARREHEYLQQSVDTMLDAMERFAGGDLTVSLAAQKDDEIGRLYRGFNVAVANLREMLERIQGAVDSTAEAAAQISTSTEELAAGAFEQSSQADEAATAIEEMVQISVENARNAGHTAEAAGRSGQAARDGERVVAQTVDKIRHLAAVIGDSVATVGRLGRSSQQIGEITQVIDEIADQTNLLALNAAIEAARAGDQGRGFAVVADEVRKLAERTTQATNEIAGRIRQIRQETEAVVAAMERGHTEVDEGIHLADEAGAALRRIVSGTHETVEMIHQIAAASEQQSATSEELSSGVVSISRVSQESAQGIQQIALSADGLTRTTEELRGLIAHFHLSQARQRREQPASLYP